MSQKLKKEIAELHAIKFNHRCRFLVLALLVIALDQLTKYLARTNLEFTIPKEVIPYFWDWSLNYNQGAAFSILANQASWSRIIFGVIALIVAIGLIYYILYRSYSAITGISLGLILGGAVGNLVDRIIFGRVTDFIDWYYKTYHWPTFNFADSCITIGVVLLLIEGFLSKKDS